MLNAVEIKYKVVDLLEAHVLHYPEANIAVESIPECINLYYVSRENDVYRISKNETKADYGVILSKENFSVSQNMSLLLVDSEWKSRKEEIGLCEFFGIVLERDYYIQKAEDRYFSCIMQEKKRLRAEGMRNTSPFQVMDLFGENATEEEWAGLYLQKYGNDAYTYWKENRCFDYAEVNRILKYFYIVKNVNYYITKYAEESMKCLAKVDQNLSEESQKIAAYKLFRRNADEDERAGYYLNLYGPDAYVKWMEAVGLHSPETERISRILKEICIERQHYA